MLMWEEGAARSNERATVEAPRYLLLAASLQPATVWTNVMDGHVVSGAAGGRRREDGDRRPLPLHRGMFLNERSEPVNSTRGPRGFDTDSPIPQAT